MTLTEQVARAIFLEAFPSFEGDPGMRERFHNYARAAIAVVREEAAKIAENPGFIQAQDTEWDEGVNYVKAFIAAALRRMGDEPTTSVKGTDHG